MPGYITQEGKKKLLEELEYLRTVRRREVAERIRNAAAQGDLSENFDYSDAKEEQESLERRITEIENTLSSSEVAPSKPSRDGVHIGARVKLESGGAEFFFTISGPQEADPLEGKISAESPLGAALLGKKAGESVEVDTPAGKTKYTIVEIT